MYSDLIRRMVLPLFKFGGLVFKTAMKPITNSLQGYARNSPRFARLSYNFANGYFKAYNGLLKTLRLPHQATPLTQEEAVEIGADLLGETILFGAAAGIIYYEVHKLKPHNVSKIQFEELEKRVSTLEEKIKK